MITDELIAAIDRGREGKSQGYSIGLPKLEQIIDGVCKKTYYLITAESGVGKSSLMLYSFIYRPLMDHLNDGKLKITLFSLEMSAELLFAKLLSTYLFEKYNIQLTLKQILSIQKDYILDDKYYNIIIQECVPLLRKFEEIITVYDKSATANYIYSHILKELEARGRFQETESRKIYIPDDPDILHIVAVDHGARVFTQPGNTLKAEMDLTSKYLYSLKNRCGITAIYIQQMNRNIQSMDRRKEGMLIPTTSDIKDSNNSVEDAEIILAIFNPNKAKLNTHKGYDIKRLGDKFRSIVVLKSRYGESEVEDFVYYDGRYNIWKEMPRSSEINDYGMFDNPKWFKDNMKGIEYVEDKPDEKPKFIL